MKVFMNLALTLLAAVALAAAVLVMLYIAVTEWRATPATGVKPACEPRTRLIAISQLSGGCTRDGLMITSMDRLRAAVTVADRMISTGRTIDGKRITMPAIREDADRFAAAQAAPAVTLEMLGRCDESLLQRYAHGYWLISSALVRESVRRRQAEREPLAVARAP